MSPPNARRTDIPAGAPGSADPDLLGTVRRLPTHVEDLRPGPPDVFVDSSDTDWSKLSWRELGRPYLVENYARRRREWERKRGRTMPVPVQWERFNRNFHALFASDVPARLAETRRELGRKLIGLRLPAVRRLVRELVELGIWNYVQRIEDAVWDPRGKRALFDGLEVERPRILFLGAAEGYEAMQLLAQYPGGEAVLVDYDDFCRTDRFGSFPETYPFLGENPRTGGLSVYRREDFEIDFVVSDIRDLDFGAEFDIVLSVGLVEHFPDEHKPEALGWHRQFLRPGGYAILTTPRRQLRSRAFYLAMGEIMNWGYRELMDERQLGLYAWENGFEILRCGYIKAHNGVVARAR
ncbi:MAG: class I SAM-dependent methyltransferase [Gemmatimonadota bacterium]|nr:class I SAM-dependent methyltransferase [Gemmatimonadota bacterium]